MTSAIARTFAVAIVALAAFMATPLPANATQCPVSVHRLASMPDGKSYGAMLVSRVQGAADVRLTLISEAATYAVTLPRVVFDREYQPAPNRAGPPFYMSAPIYVSLPETDRIDAVHADLSSPGDAKPEVCFSEYTYSPRLQAKIRPRTTLTPNAGAQSEASILLALFPRSPAAAAALVERNPPLDCAEPYAMARVTVSVTAQYPPAQQFNGPTGTAIVTVDLTPSGKPDTVAVYQSSGMQVFDLTALKVAAATTYSPEYFRCKPIGGRYIFVVDFGFPGND